MRSSSGSHIASRATSRILMSLTKKPQAKAPMSRDTKAIQSSVFCGGTNPPYYQIHTDLRVTAVTQSVKHAEEACSEGRRFSRSELPSTLFHRSAWKGPSEKSGCLVVAGFHSRAREN